MSFCAKITLTRVDDCSVAVSRIGSNASCKTRRIDDGSAALTRSDKFSWRLAQVCRASVSMPYLEIRPTIVWMLSGYTENEVLSNTRWNVD